MDDFAIKNYLGVKKIFLVEISIVEFSRNIVK